MNPTRLRKSILALGIAAGTFSLAPSAHAGTKEIAAINLQLPTGITIATADATQLRDAVIAAINNSTLSPSVIAGEALKGAGTAAGDFGAVLGTAIAANPPARVTALTLPKFAAGAAVAASTGSNANAEDVPAFAQFFVASTETAVSTAKLATKSNTAIGAIIGGHAIEETDANLDELTLAAFADKKLKKAAQQIAQYVGDVADNPAAYATTVSKASISNLQKVANGVTASNPDLGADIVDALIDDATTKVQVVKIAPKLAKSVGLLGSVEEVQGLAESLGAIINPNQVKSTAKALVQAISGRKALSEAATGVNSTVNKAEEVGEVIAFYINALNDNPLIAAQFDTSKAAKKLVLSVAQQMFKGAKVKTIKSLGQKSTDLQDALVATAGNFAASLTYTLTLMDIDDQIVLDIIAELKAKATKIGGKKYAAQLVTQFDLGAAATLASGYEDGTRTAFVGPVIDPETDTRNG